MATAHRTGNKRPARRRVNGAQTDFDEEVFGARGAGGAAGDESEIEPVVRKVLGELLSEVSEELESPEGEPPPAEGGPSRAFSRAGTGGGAIGAPDEDEEAVPPEVSEAVQAVMSELSAEQTQAIASLFEAMGEASDGRPQEGAAMGFGTAAAAGISSADFRSLDQATAQGVVGPVVRWIIRWLRGPGRKYWTQAVGAAKRGTKAFMAWKNRLPWPVRLAISGLGPYAVEELVKLIASQAGVAEARRTSAAASAGPEPGDPDETEQAVRTVLADLLMKAAEELQSSEEESPDEEEQPSALASDAGDLELESAEEARAEGERLVRASMPIGPYHPIVIALRAAKRLYAAAVRAAKGGPRSFNRWVNQLSNFNPVKWAIKALPNNKRAALIAWLARQNVPARARSAAATAGETEPAEIEQVVRRVLGQALSGSQSPSAIA